MRRKQILVLLILAALTTGVGFAEGSRERAPSSDFGPRGMSFDTETTEVTGRLSFEAWGHPVVTSATKSYHLMVPRWAVDDLDVVEGQQVTVEGFLVTDAPWEGDETYLRVTRAVIDGQEFELDDFGGGRMGARGHGPKGDWDRSRRMDDDGFPGGSGRRGGRS